MLALHVSIVAAIMLEKKLLLKENE